MNMDCRLDKLFNMNGFEKMGMDVDFIVNGETSIGYVYTQEANNL